MGLLATIAFAGIRHRKLASAITVFMTAATACTIVMAIGLSSVISEPWQRTFDAANGAHVLGSLPTEGDARDFAAMPGVVEAADPVPVVMASIRFEGESVKVHVAGVDELLTVNKPVVVEGNGNLGTLWLERSLAQALGINVGEVVHLESGAGSTQLSVDSLAVLPSQSRFPRQNPGLIWLPRAALTQIVPDSTTWRWLQAVRIANPDAASLLASTAYGKFLPSVASFETWDEQRASAEKETQPFQVALITFAVLLVVVSVVVTAFLITSRIGAQQRDFAVLKAIGAAPGQVGIICALEFAVLASFGWLLGALPGVALVPRLASTASASLLTAPDASFNPTGAIVALAVVVPIASIGAWLAGRRAAISMSVSEGVWAREVVPRRSVVRALARWLRVPLSAEVGLAALVSRPSRVRLMSGSFALTGMVTVLGLLVRSELVGAGSTTDVPQDLPASIVLLNAALIVITFAGLAALVMVSIAERKHDLTVARAIGFDAMQILWSVALPYALLGMVASGIAAPFGVLIYALLAENTAITSVNIEWGIAVSVPIAFAICAFLVGVISARGIARRRVGEALRTTL